MLFAAIISTLLATSYAWILQTNNNTIEPGITQNVKLVCNWDNDSKTTAQIQSISRIRITKNDPFFTKYTFADLRSGSNSIIKSDENVNVTGSTILTKKPFLQVIWPTATIDTAGSYGCEVSGFDDNQDVVNILVPPTLIKEKLLRLNEVKELLRLAKEDNLREIRKLGDENEQLKSFIKEKLEKLSQRVHSQETTLLSEISKSKQEMIANYVTKQELAFNVTMLQKFTMNKIMDDNIEDDKKHSHIYSLIKETSESIELNYTKLISINENLENGLKDDIRKQSELFRKSLTPIISRQKNLTDELSSIDDKCKNLTDEFLRQKHKVCTCPTVEPSSSTTRRSPATDQDPEVSPMSPTVTTLSHTPSQWPEGQYALLEFGTGCPEPQRNLNNGRKTFEELPLDIYSDTKVTLQNLFFIQDYDRDLPFKGEIKFCRKINPTISKDIPWPRGSYCINEYLKKCSNDNAFQTGFMIYKNQGSVDFLMQFCCRSDGALTSSIQLPNEKPFYLYRFGGSSCQQVKGMTVRERILAIDDSLQGGITLTNGTTHPDVKDKEMLLCYYVPI